VHPNCCKFEFPLQLLASQDVYTKELTDARKQIDELKAQLRDAEFRAGSAKLAASGGGAGHAQPSLPETPLANELAGTPQTGIKQPAPAAAPSAAPAVPAGVARDTVSDVLQLSQASTLVSVAGASRRSPVEIEAVFW
jgi:hypothetical protein